MGENVVLPTLTSLSVVQQIPLLHIVTNQSRLGARPHPRPVSLVLMMISLMCVAEVKVGLIHGRVFVADVDVGGEEVYGVGVEDGGGGLS